MYVEQGRHANKLLLGKFKLMVSHGVVPRKDEFASLESPREAESAAVVEERKKPPSVKPLFPLERNEQQSVPKKSENELAFMMGGGN